MYVLEPPGPFLPLRENAFRARRAVVGFCGARDVKKCCFGVLWKARIGAEGHRATRGAVAKRETPWRRVIVNAIFELEI